MMAAWPERKPVIPLLASNALAEDTECKNLIIFRVLSSYQTTAFWKPLQPSTVGSRRKLSLKALRTTQGA